MPIHGDGEVLAGLLLVEELPSDRVPQCSPKPAACRAILMPAPVVSEVGYRLGAPQLSQDRSGVLAHRRRTTTDTSIHLMPGQNRAERRAAT